MSGIWLNDVSVDFTLYGAEARSLRGNLPGAHVGGTLSEGPARRVHIHALQRISLCLKEGDRVGVLGQNGAGKSTLLRVICGVFEPTAGEVKVEGRIATLFDPALAMQPEMTGQEYIVLRGLYFGFRKRDILARMAEIESVSELGEYLSMPVRAYSAGMKLRLAFAASTWFSPDIVLMDEMIGIVDSGFLHRAETRLQGFVRSAGIVVLASHSERIIRTFCNRAVILDHGRITADGPIDEVLSLYEATIAESRTQ